MPLNSRLSDAAPGSRYLLILAGLLLTALAGYGDFRLYVFLDTSDVLGAGLIAFAALARVGAFFSPCSFPLLVGVLALDNDVPKKDIAKHAAVFAIGATAFLLLVGVIVGVVGSTAFSEVSFASTMGRGIRLAAGTLMILFALAVWAEAFADIVIG